MEIVRVDEFSSRFVALVMHSRGLPKKARDREILWISAATRMEPERSYSESELNDMLRQWVVRYGEMVDLDHVTLRRYLIDAGYLARDAAGTSYHVASPAEGFPFDVSIRSLDLDELILDEEERRAARKARYTDSLP